MFTLICGIPNAGKTTYSQNFENVIHMDELRPKKGHPTRSYVVDALKKAEGDICVEGVYVMASSRKRLADAYKGKKLCIFLDTPLDEAKRRENRGRPLFIIENSHHHLEPPTFDEGWDEIIIKRPDGEEHLVKGE